VLEVIIVINWKHNTDTHTLYSVFHVGQWVCICMQKCILVFHAQIQLGSHALNQN